MNIARIIALLTSIVSFAISQPNYYFTGKNSEAIRDSLNQIKYVDPNKAVRFAFEILEKYDQKRPNRVIGAAYAALGQIYHIKGLTSHTLEYLYLAESEFGELLGNKQPWILVDIGNVYYSQGFQRKADSLYISAYTIFNNRKFRSFEGVNGQTDNQTGIAVALNNRALVAIKNKNFLLAENLYKKGLTARMQISNVKSSDLAHSYLGLASLYLNWKKFDKVTAYCDSVEIILSTILPASKKNSKELKDTYNRHFGTSKQLRAQLFDELDQRKSAETYFNEAGVFFKSLPIENVGLKIARASFNKNSGNLKTALTDINNGLTLAKEQGLSRERFLLLNSKKELLTEIGATKELKKINKLLIELNIEKIFTQNQDLMINLNLKKDLRAGQRELRKTKAQRKQMAGLSIAIFAILSLIIIVIKNKASISEQLKIVAEQKKQIAEYNLKSKDHELKSASASVMEKDEMIEAIKKDIDYASEFLSNSDAKYLMNPLRSKIKNAEPSKSSWKKFQAKFNKTNPYFLESMAKLNPDLNLKDLRLCTYIKSGQTTQEIAQHTGLSIRSVESRRYRLRKKLKLNSKTSLHDFIFKKNISPD